MGDNYLVGEIDLISGFNPESLLHWRQMLRKCYAEEWPRQQHEEAKVCPEWLKFSFFNIWISKFPADVLINRKIIINPLLKGSKVFEPESCLFVSPAFAHFLRSQMRDEGKLEEYVTIFPAKGYPGLFMPDNLDVNQFFEWHVFAPPLISKGRYFFLQPYPAKVYISLYNKLIEQLKQFQKEEELNEVAEMISQLILKLRERIENAKGRVKAEAVKVDALKKRTQHLNDDFKLHMLKQISDKKINANHVEKKIDQQCEVSKIPLFQINKKYFPGRGKVEKAALDYFESLGYEGIHDEGLNLFNIFRFLFRIDTLSTKNTKCTEIALKDAIVDEYYDVLKSKKEACQNIKDGEEIDLWMYQLPSVSFCHKVIDKIGIDTLRRYAWNHRLSPVGAPDLTLLCDKEIVLYEVKSKYDFLTSFQINYMPVVQKLFPVGVVRVNNRLI